MEEEKATIEDFFSDENESAAGSSSEEDEDDFSASPTRVPKGDKAMKKKRKRKTAGPLSALPSADLTPAEFRKRGKELIDFLADYLEGSRDRPVNHQAIQGYLFRKMPRIPPRDGVSMDEVYKEVKQYIFPGLAQWQSPKHHSLLPAGGSYASILGSMLCDGLGCVGLTWADCPAITELEMLVMNWLAHLMDLPIDFHFFGKGMSGGGGILQSTTTEALLTVMVTAKRTMLDHLKETKPQASEWSLQDQFMAYCSEQAHPSMERVCEVAGVKLKRLWTDREGIMHADTLRFAIEKDKNKGFYPFLVIATVGTIACTSMDQIRKIGPISVANDLFPLLISVPVPSQWPRKTRRSGYTLMLAMPEVRSSAASTSPCFMELMVKKAIHFINTFACEDPQGPLYIPKDDKNTMADYRNWSLPMTRRFRAMKLWIVFKLYGVRGLQQKIREDVRRAKELEKLIGEDHRFEIMGDVMFGVVAFRCKRPDNNEINHQILKQINKSAVIKMTGARVGFKYWLRFVVSGRYTDSEDVKFSWEMIRRTTNKVTQMKICQNLKASKSFILSPSHLILSYPAMHRSSNTKHVS
ncbi:Aromatic amino acid decarboxylase [Plakobranchus ocellatus]|uniref:Aromatic amino acid decarboxylase n=1 Tax=Plakobranchus ocellatus TaxID=259542 RepID=A0AAV3Y1J8_9GAST|nr:Aromatic amino acid decarboxylase [Plakobranchus ocellatus]